MSFLCSSIQVQANPVSSKADHFRTSKTERFLWSFWKKVSHWLLSTNVQLFSSLSVMGGGGRTPHDLKLKNRDSVQKTEAKLYPPLKKFLITYAVS